MFIFYLFLYLTKKNIVKHIANINKVFILAKQNVYFLNKFFIIMDKALILNILKNYKNFRTNKQFAEFLDISPQNLSKWYERNTFDIDRLFTKFPEVSLNWLMTGEGDMLQKSCATQTNSGNAGNNITMIQNVDGLYKSNEKERCEKTPVISSDMIRKTDLNIWKFVHDNIDNIEKISMQNIYSDYDLFYRVISDSMKPTIEKGDLLVLRKVNDMKKIVNGDCYMVDTVDYGCVVRMLYYENGVYSCKANIPEYSDITLSENEIYNIFSIVGLVRPLVTPRSDYKDKIFELKTKDIQINELIDNIGKLIDHITKK